ncbi:hypothetical protein P692DRAFT_20828635 [Suillus brevipes Sb2]|nr:hypothetical protein P692DRAFT_20828635 [Suillus brevipes Sb2]
MSGSAKLVYSFPTPSGFAVGCSHELQVDCAAATMWKFIPIPDLKVLPGSVI